MVAIGAAEKTNLEVQHIAAALGPEKGRAPALNKDLADLTERMKKAGGKSVFEAEIAENPDDKFVNFDEMRRVLEDENKRVASESDRHKKADMQKRYDRLSRRYSVYDKLLNNEGFGTMNVAEQREMMSVMADLPGFCESIALATNNTLTIEQARQIMMGKGGVALSPDQRKVISEMILQFANDGKLHNRISKGLSELVVDKQDAVLSHEIDTLKDGLKDEALKKAALAKVDTTLAGFDARTEPEKDRILKMAEISTRYLAAIDDANKPAIMTKVGVDTMTSQLKSKKDAAEKKLNAAITAKKADTSSLENAFNNLENQHTAASALQTLFSAPNAEADYNESIKVMDAQTKKTSLAADLKKINDNKADITAKEGERSKYADKYKRKMEVTLSEEMKRYWNEVKLSQAQNAAEGEAQKKAEEKQKLETEKAKREALAKTILDKYLHLSFIKYKGNKAVGMDDKALKDFVKKDMLSKSPAQLAKDFLGRIDSGRYVMPPEYAKEIKKMYSEAGIGVGTPPLTLRKAMEEIGNDKWEAWAAEKVPDVLGYAYDRKYYFDRLKLSRAQGEFLKRAYIDTDFFQKAQEAKDKYMKETESMLGTEFVNGKNWEAFKKAMGGDWVGGSKRAMKTLAVAGAIGAGAYTLGGGFSAGLLLPTPHNVLATGVNVLSAGNAALGATSRVGEVGINAVSTTATDLFRRVLRRP
ncbi:hypothetical protein HZC27_01575 [Candidatus Roizmanbacteria bacterium]|nr:hypothetical protein [Candidatus Roizmanbacteria bacterium]